VPEIIIPRVSVIVASHREQFVEELVSSFDALDSESVPMEIIIVADYPIEHYRDTFPHIRWIHVPDISISAKRNRGIENAKGSICAFIDDDCRPSGKWLSRAVAFLDDHPDMAGVEGMTSIASTDTREGSYREFKRLEKRGYRTNNIFYRRDILLSVNMFDERFTVQREDVDLAYAILESGQCIGYSTELKVEHQFRKNEKWDLLKNCINRRFDPLLYKKHKRLYRQYIRTPYPPGSGGL
jgi:glycosyltransferase involved in cell wall biosynthesis